MYSQTNCKFNNLKKNSTDDTLTQHIQFVYSWVCHSKMNTGASAGTALLSNTEEEKLRRGPRFLSCIRESVLEVTCFRTDYKESEVNGAANEHWVQRRRPHRSVSSACLSTASMTRNCLCAMRKHTEALTNWQGEAITSGFKKCDAMAPPEFSFLHAQQPHNIPLDAWVRIQIPCTGISAYARYQWRHVLLAPEVYTHLIIMICSAAPLHAPTPW